MNADGTGLTQLTHNSDRDSGDHAGTLSASELWVS